MAKAKQQRSQKHRLHKLEAKRARRSGGRKRKARRPVIQKTPMERAFEGIVGPKIKHDYWD